MLIFPCFERSDWPSHATADLRSVPWGMKHDPRENRCWESHEPYMEGYLPRTDSRNSLVLPLNLIAASGASLTYIIRCAWVVPYENMFERTVCMVSRYLCDASEGILRCLRNICALIVE